MNCLKVSFYFFVLLFAFSQPAHAESRKYYAPPSGFNAAFQIMDQGLSNVMGFFADATGAFSYDAEKNEISHIKLAIETSGLSTPSRDAGSDMTALLAPRQFPEIVFMATAPSAVKDGKAEVKGTLTVKGQSKPATFQATLNQNKENNKSVGLSLTGSFKRTDFDMGDPPEIPGRFGETMTLMLEMKAIGQ